MIKKNLIIMYTLQTNEWTDARLRKPWKGRDVLCRLDTGDMLVLRWNGVYWTDRNNIRQCFSPGRGVTHFYIFERFVPQEE